MATGLPVQTSTPGDVATQGKGCWHPPVIPDEIISSSAVRRWARQIEQKDAGPVVLVNDPRLD